MAGQAAEHAGFLSAELREPEIAIIIPTMDNRAYLEPCLRSILLYTTGIEYFIYVINNGAPNSCDWLLDEEWNTGCRIGVQDAGSNLGWEGGLQLGLEAGQEPYVLFLNDDTLLPPSSARWLAHMRRHLCDPNVGAVGPATNCAAGAQQIGYIHAEPVFSVRYLIGFCLLLRRATLAEIGGIDHTLPGGDDIDLSLRLRAAGYRLLADRGVFLYHHGFVTGTRLRGPWSVPGGWNSLQMQRRTMEALVAKHGSAAVEGLWG